MSERIDGRSIARTLIEDLQQKRRPTTTLAVFLVGDDPSSVSFIQKKRHIADVLGVSFTLYQYDAHEGEATLLEKLKALATDSSIGGIVLQLPLPPEFDRDRFIAEIPPEKDVDNLTGQGRVLEPVVLTAQAVLDATQSVLDHKVVAVVGRGFLIGEPIIRWAKPRASRVIVLDRDTGLLNIHEADVVISGVGVAGLIDPVVLKKDAAVIDFGYDYDDRGRISGDLDQRSVDFERLSWFTPTPGGTGPILVAKLFENFYRLTGSYED